MMTNHEKYLIKRLHALLARLGFNGDAKREMLFESYGVISSSDLTTKQLVELCDSLEYRLSSKKKEIDLHRKRVIAAIGGWLTALGRENEIGVIKAIASRAAEAKSFNDIPLERLRSIYNAFLKKQKDLRFVDNLTKVELDISQYLN